MLKKTLLVLLALLAALGVGIFLSYTALKGRSLFDNRTAQLGLVASAIVGLILGAAGGMLKKKNAIKGEWITRHGVGSVIEHWGTGFGIFTLIYSGIMMGFFIINSKSIGFIPVFARTLQGVIPALNVHYFAVLLILFGGFFFLADYVVTGNWTMLIPNIQDIIGGFFGKYFLRRPWEKEDKYLSSQKAAFLPFAIIGIVMLATGAIKVAAHIWPITATVWGWATVIHDVFMALTILYIIVHVAIVVALGHWPAFISYFTGTISTKYVEHHHPVWYEKLTSGTNKS